MESSFHSSIWGNRSFTSFCSWCGVRKQIPRFARNDSIVNSLDKTGTVMLCPYTSEKIGE